MSNFPEIEHVDQLRQKVSHHPEIRFTTHNNGFTIVSYMIGNSELWSGDDADWVMECRGITFDKDGNTASRSLHKFFNIDERPKTKRELIEWDNTVRLMDKRDGCCDAETEIETGEGIKTIKWICENNYLGTTVGFDTNSNEYCLSLITATSILENNNDWVELELENNQKIKLTGNHQVFVSNKNRYTEVRFLEEGDDVILL